MTNENKETKIKELKTGMDKLNLTVEIDMVAPKKNYWEYGETPRITIIVKDDSGDIKMTLFEEENVKKAKEGKRFKITNGYVTEYNGQLQLNSIREDPIVWL